MKLTISPDNVEEHSNNNIIMISSYTGKTCLAHVRLSIKDLSKIYINEKTNQADTLITVVADYQRGLKEENYSSPCIDLNTNCKSPIIVGNRAIMSYLLTFIGGTK